MTRRAQGAVPATGARELCRQYVLGAKPLKLTTFFKCGVNLLTRRTFNIDNPENNVHFCEIIIVYSAASLLNLRLRKNPHQQG
jgi:hypothetical protein